MYRSFNPQKSVFFRHTISIWRRRSASRCSVKVSVTMRLVSKGFFSYNLSNQVAKIDGETYEGDSDLPTKDIIFSASYFHFYLKTTVILHPCNGRFLVLKTAKHCSSSTWFVQKWNGATHGDDWSQLKALSAALFRRMQQTLSSLPRNLSCQLQSDPRNIICDFLFRSPLAPRY